MVVVVLELSSVLYILLVQRIFLINLVFYFQVRVFPLLSCGGCLSIVIMNSKIEYIIIWELGSWSHRFCFRWADSEWAAMRGNSKCQDAAAAAAKSLQSCLTLHDPMDWSPPGSPVHRIFQARVLEWDAITFSEMPGWGRCYSETCSSLGSFQTVFSSVQWLSNVWLFVTPWIAASQASLSIILLKLRSIESVMLSSHLILYHPLLLLPSIFPSIRVFSTESGFCIRWPKYWSFSFNISPSNDIQDWFPLEWIGWISLQYKGL